ncbi:MAG: hypothetical protein ACTSX6_01165 [Candidatus Heimdallarchaeaceae archaeon]
MPLLELIQNDLDTLPQYVSGLEKVTMFDYNTSFLPGCVYLLVSPIELNHLANVSNATIDYICSHSDQWWYVANLSIELLDLSELYLDLLLDNFDDFSGIFLLTTFSNYSIVNNTLVIDYPKRNNVSASFYYYNGSLWVPNLAFCSYCNEKIEYINQQPIFNHTGTSIVTHYSEQPNATEISNNILNYFNITPTITNETTYVEINHTLYTTGSGTFRASYADSLNYDDKITLYFTLFAVIKHLWFITDVNSPNWIPIGVELPYYIPLGLIGSFLLVFAILILILKIRKRKRRQ